MQRWVLEQGGRVRGYLLTSEAPDSAAKRRLAFGPEEDGTGDLAAAGTWRLVPESAGLVGDDWTFDGATYAAPVRT